MFCRHPNDELPDTEEKVNSAIKQVGLDTKVENLSNGINTYIETVFDETGTQLSGGQFQRLALARAIYRDAPILILDEPTAALDPRAEYEIYKNFYDMSKNKTTLFVSHRLGSSRICDRIIVFQEGAIVEDGNHDELLSKKCLYWENTMDMK